MSRLVSLLIVLLAIAVATPVLAEQRLTLGGEMRVRGYSIVAQDYEKSSAESAQYYDQRLRFVGRIAVAEGVGVHFLSDHSVGNWGTAANQGGTRGWLNVDVGPTNIRAGKFFYSIGNQIALDIVGTGAVFTLKGQVPVEFAYFRQAQTDTAQDAQRDIYTLSVGHSTDMYKAVVFGGYKRDGGSTTTAKSDIYLVGMQTNMNLDPVKLNFELNYFTGKDDVSGTAPKYRGLQAFLDAGMDVADNVTVGAMGFYARGYSNKADTEQYISFANNGGSFLPETYGAMSTLYNAFSTNYGASAIFDPSGDEAGTRAAQLYGNVKIMDPLTANAAVGYARPDKKVDMKSIYWAKVGGTYNLATRTNLDGSVSYAKPSFRDSTTEDDARIVAAFRLRVNF